ncbi:hypothetical protein ASZ78_007653 [Callipepla squamata]|uniref:Reelin domain-containing protein n=1 Tax=Callipepla squamata TaxID=9009 RepID=A0A226MUN6_CALSU|nr:hypothetical protein ASZ78_007653 [Callipepla squamata]
MEGCDSLQNATAGNFSVTVTPETYMANTSYQVTISDGRNHTAEGTATKYLFQALSSASTTVGEWKGVEIQNCSDVETAVLNATQEATANWTSPGHNISSVEIRAYIIFDSSSAEFKTVNLQEAPETEPTTATTTPNSVSAVQSSFFIAITQLLLLLTTSKLLS